MRLKLSLTRLERLGGYRSSYRAGQSSLEFAIKYTEKGWIIGRAGGRCPVSSDPSRSLVAILTTQLRAAGCAALRTYYLSTLTRLTDLTCKALP